MVSGIYCGADGILCVSCEGHGGSLCVRVRPVFRRDGTPETRPHARGLGGVHTSAAPQSRLNGFSLDFFFRVMFGCT